MMQRKDLKKAIKKFSNKTNFYKLGLVKKYLKEQYKEEQKLIKAIPKVVCPHCGSNEINIDDDGSEYSPQEFLTCRNCWESFDDTFGFTDAIEEVKSFPWNDSISIALFFEEPDIKTLEWQEFCEKAIKVYLGLIKIDPVSSIF